MRAVTTSCVSAFASIFLFFVQSVSARQKPGPSEVDRIRLSSAARLGGILLQLTLAITIATLCGCTSSQQKTPADRPPPSVDQSQVVDGIFDKYAAAIGGQEAVDRVSTYSMKGTIEMTGRTVRLPVEIYVKKPDKTLMVVEVPRFGTIRRGRGAGKAWTQTPFTGVTEDSPNEITQIERDHDIYQAAKIRELYREVKLERQARLSGRDVYIVEGKPAEGPAEKMLFDMETGLLLRWNIVRRIPGKPTVFARVYLDDYREVGGVKVPFTIRYYFEPREVVVRLAEVTHDVPLDDAMFERPQGVR